MKACLQSGHWGRTSGATGAPEEMANNKRITDRLSAVLRSKGIKVYQTDAYGYNDPKVTKVDYDLFLSLHCDMDYKNDNGGGFADYANPETDYATAESQRICKILNDNYFPEVKIQYVPRSNLNTRNYYMWKYLTKPTPAVIIEMGQSIDPHDKVLLANTNLIANALGMAICKALGVDYEINSPDPKPDSFLLAKEKEIVDLNETIKNLRNDLKVAQTENLSKLAEKDKQCQEKLTAYKLKINDYLINCIKEYK